MAFTSTPFAQQNVPINADVVRQAVSSLVPNGGGLVQAGDLAVSQLATPGMSVQVAPGRVWVDGTTVAHLSGQGYGKQAQYFGLNDAPLTLTIAAADPTNPRIDVVYVAIQDSAYAGTVNGGGPAVVTGVASATPVVPVIPSNAIALAQVSVAANASSITNTNITAQNITIVGPNRVLAPNAATQSAINAFPGLEVGRTDLAGVPTFTYDGSQYWPQQLGPLGVSGWGITGYVDVNPVGTYKRAVASLHINRTGGAFTATAGSYTTIGGSGAQIMPNAATSANAPNYYLPGVVISSTTPYPGVLFINGTTGSVSFNPETTFTWATNGFLDVNVNYFV